MLKAMTYETTGALIAAPTTSLPEDIGGVRNWDYRYCWLRDSVLALQALIAAGYVDEAMAFRDFILHTATGDPSKLQIMYAIAGERRLTEFELPELPGYEGSRPVRVGNAASEQFQLDVYGEVLNVAYLGVQLRGRIEPRLWPRWRKAIEYVETIWREPDDGIWESRGPRRHYTYSKVMAWVVFDRAVRLAEQFDLDAPVDRWRLTRDEIHQEICDRGYDRERRTFTQYYGSSELDASVLNIPLVGFLPGSDERVTGTIDAIVARAGARRLRLPLLHRGHRRRPHRRRGAVPGLLVLARECVGGQRSDPGSPRSCSSVSWGWRTTSGCWPRSTTCERQRQVGNFPQAFSHLTLVLAAHAITNAEARAAAVNVEVLGGNGMRIPASDVQRFTVRYG